MGEETEERTPAAHIDIDVTIAFVSFLLSGSLLSILAAHAAKMGVRGVEGAFNRVWT